ncbi:uncharacterized protein LOC126836203 [Adelges cooleyi]|uniref:uncharacterized protein LOC126836203 n=1 Tax=Adelges cooleyi TaxID=133065 RepID=UPI00217F6BFE|nr:uncharacterized protein LOC126836203 [Adelges cooleyi]XP_050425357.1 uncharacterized protein LOC126836203 [Adelges cooleyi]XP_050425358.1 uncharacterized protein LOC126836203 [Adelges cooleyi]
MMDEYGNPTPGTSMEFENIVVTANSCDFTWLVNEFKHSDTDEDEKPDVSNDGYMFDGNYHDLSEQKSQGDPDDGMKDFFDEIRTIDFDSIEQKSSSLREELLDRCVSFIDTIGRNIVHLEETRSTFMTNIAVSKRNAAKAHKVIKYERKLLSDMAIPDLKKKAHLANFFKIGLSNCPHNPHLMELYETGRLILSYNGRFILEECVERNLWNQEFKNKLEQAIHEEVLDKIKTPMLAQQARLGRDLVAIDDPVIKRKIKVEIMEIQKELDVLSKTPFQRLVFQFMESDTKYDWLHIAKVTNKSDVQCQRFWNLMLKPYVSRSKWTKEEDKNLIKLAKKYGEKNWTHIAEELETNRNELQCFVHYQKYKGNLYTKGKWSKEEDIKLMRVIKENSIEKMINWQKVYYGMHDSGRSNDQIYNRWMFSLKPGIKKGLLDDKEKMIISAAQKNNIPASVVSMNLTNRTTTQIRNAYRRNLSYLSEIYRGGWVPEEDKLLLSAVNRHAPNEWTWSEISKQVPGRNAEQCRHRFKLIEKKIEQNPNLTIDCFPRATHTYRVKTLPELPDDLESVHNVVFEGFKESRQSLKARNQLEETDADRKLKKAFLDNAYIKNHCNFSSKCELLNYVLNYLGADLRVPDEIVHKDDFVDEGLMSMLTYLKQSSNQALTFPNAHTGPDEGCDMVDFDFIHEGVQGALRTSDIINSSMSELRGLMDIRVRDIDCLIKKEVKKEFKYPEIKQLVLPLHAMGSVPPNYETFKMLYTYVSSLSSCLKTDTTINPGVEFDWDSEESKKLHHRLVTIFRWPALFSGMVDYNVDKLNMLIKTEVTEDQINETAHHLGLDRKKKPDFNLKLFL